VTPPESTVVNINKRIARCSLRQQGARVRRTIAGFEQWRREGAGFCQCANDMQPGGHLTSVGRTNLISANRHCYTRNRGVVAAAAAAAGQ